MAYRSLEKHPFFGYIAWSVVIGFALFVASLAIELNREITQLSEIAGATDTALDNW